MRNKRTQFWGKDKNDDRLVRQILDGKKTATADIKENYNTPYGDYDDGGYEVGDIVDVFDLQERLRCKIKITEVYSTRFCDIPEKLWRGEGNSSAEEFQADHRYCWAEYNVTDELEIMVNHFELVEIVNNT